MNRLKPFSHLKEVPDICDLLSIGAKHHNYEDPTNPHLECTFVGRTIGRVYVSIAAGYLPYIWPGQVYLRGINVFGAGRQTTYPPRAAGCTKITFNTKNVQESTFLEAKLDEYSFLPNINGLPVKIISASNEFNIPYFVIPEVELIRFYYAKSDKLAKAIFTGHFDSDLISKFIINTNHEKPRFIGNTFRFMYRHGFSHSDALIIGRILASEEALQSVRRVHNSIIKDNINSSSHNTANFRSGFPFSGETTLDVEGYIDPLSGAFFVQRILSCTGPFPFAALSHCDEIQAGNPNPNGEKMKMPGQGSGKNFNMKGESTSTNGPDSAIKAITLKLMTCQQTGAFDIDIKSEKLSESTHVSDKQVEQIRPTVDPEDVSTGNIKNNNSKKGKQNIIDELVSKPTMEMYHFKCAIKKLTEENVSIKNLTSQCLMDAHYDDSLGEYVTPFPKVICDHKNSYRIFSYINAIGKSPRERRLTLCFSVEIHTSKGIQFAYFFAAENRQVKTAKKLPIAILYKKNRGKISARELREFLISTVKNSGWPKYNAQSELSINLLNYEETTIMTKKLHEKFRSIFLNETFQ